VGDVKYFVLKQGSNRAWGFYSVVYRNRIGKERASYTILCSETGEI